MIVVGRGLAKTLPERPSAFRTIHSTVSTSPEALPTHQRRWKLGSAAYYTPVKTTPVSPSSWLQTAIEAFKSSRLVSAGDAETEGSVDSSVDNNADHYKLVIIGTGWAGYQMFTQCNKHIADIEATVGRPVDIEVISRRNVSSLVEHYRLPLSLY